MAYVVDVPVEGGGRLLVEATGEPSGDLELASPGPGEVVARARQSLEQALDQLTPAVSAVVERLRRMAPQEFSVEFGLKLGAETGFVVAKGKSEVNFTVTLAWNQAASGQAAQSGQSPQPPLVE